MCLHRCSHTSVSSADSAQGPASRKPAPAAHRDAVPLAASVGSAWSEPRSGVAPAADGADAYEATAEDDDRLQPWDDPVEMDVRAEL